MLIRKMERILPITVIEEILSYLNAIDRCNAVQAFLIDRNKLGRFVHSKMSLSMDFRFHPRMISTLLANVKAQVTELDLTGIYWIPAYILKDMVLRLNNLENLYLIGTNIVLSSQEEISCFNKLKKLKNIVITMKEAICILHHGPFFQHFACELEEHNVRYKSKMTFYLLPKSTSGLPIHNDNWLEVIKKSNDDKIFEAYLAKFEDSFLSLSYSHLFNESSIIHDKVVFMYQRANSIKKISIRRENQHIGSSHLDLSFLASFTNLTELYLDVISNIGPSYLKVVFLTCPLLRKLFLDVHTGNMSLVHLKYAKNLQDLSVEMRKPVSVNLDKIFFDLKQHSHVQLRRLRLHFYDAPTENLNKMEEYLKANSQLIFMLLTCLMGSSKIRIIQRILKAHTKNATHVYLCYNATTLGQTRPLHHKELPVVFWDMVDTFALNHDVNESK